MCWLPSVGFRVLASDNVRKKAHPGDQLVLALEGPGIYWEQFEGVRTIGPATTSPASARQSDGVRLTFREDHVIGPRRRKFNASLYKSRENSRYGNRAAEKLAVER